MKVLVTGGAGFIGSAVVRNLVRQTGVYVVNVDKLTYAGNLHSLGSVSEERNYNFRRADICDKEGMRQLFRHDQPDAVIHLAAESHVDRSIDCPDAFLQTNVLGTGSLLQAATEYCDSLAEAKRRRFRFLHVSTDEVYGDLGSTRAPVDESAPYNPSSPYAATKASSDHLVRAWGRTYGIPVLIANCSNNYGPCQFPEKLIPHTILNALAGRRLPVYGDGSQVRDWLYVEDHARALWTVLMHGSPGDAYNIGGRSERRNLDVVLSICRLLDEAQVPVSTRTRHDELITFVEDRPGHDMRYAVGTAKIERELGWKPMETFDSGLRKTVHWYLENRRWWQDVLDGSYRLERLGVRAAQ